MSELDQMMERASKALADMDYTACEQRCLEALASARQAGDWTYYGRILLPLQEARRQRRMIAADGKVRLGVSDSQESVTTWMQQMQAGCVVVTRPHQPQAARNLVQRTQSAHRLIEVLYADNLVNSPVWTIRSFRGPPVSCARPAPVSHWLDRWLDAAAYNPASAPPPATESVSQVNPTMQPADWFLDACEALGDAALAQVSTDLVGIDQVAALERCLLVVTDHEILHQHLGEAVRAI